MSPQFWEAMEFILVVSIAFSVAGVFALVCEAIRRRWF